MAVRQAAYGQDEAKAAPSWRGACQWDPTCDRIPGIAPRVRPGSRFGDGRVAGDDRRRFRVAVARPGPCQERATAIPWLRTSAAWTAGGELEGPVAVVRMRAPCRQARGEYPAPANVGAGMRAVRTRLETGPPRNRRPRMPTRNAGATGIDRLPLPSSRSIKAAGTCRTPRERPGLDAYGPGEMHMGHRASAHVAVAPPMTGSVSPPLHQRAVTAQRVLSRPDVDARDRFVGGTPRRRGPASCRASVRGNRSRGGGRTLLHNAGPAAMRVVVANARGRNHPRRPFKGVT
jgi:hypothetical protein